MITTSRASSAAPGTWSAPSWQPSCWFLSGIPLAPGLQIFWLSPRRLV